MRFRAFLVLTLVSWACVAAGNPWNRKVVLQGFWWNYWNNHYPNNWSTYLADLAPRLREMGIDAVWIPPTIKNKNATGSVGYSPFDHYDLGDKYQGGSTATRFGTKDEYLRAVAILHANGIDVIQDVVWNHMDGAGTETGLGGEDPAAPSNKWKNFRYASYATPGTVNSFANYSARRGRFPKNWHNFHPNPDHNTEGDEITAGYFGPDICYYREARGLSSNMSYNPAQGVDYMRNGMRNWSIWMKKQTGVDGFRIDAVKHFETWATQDFLWNLAYNAGFASGGSQMYAVGEWVGSSAQMDGWIDAVNSANGGTTDLVGTFDFNLRGALKSVIDSGGSYNLASIPGAQQNRRSRTAPFVNSHDTFRPNVDGTGRITGWDTANEIGGHINVTDARAQMVYAIALAVDGSPNIFFEDLFDIGTTGKRWTHHPTNTVDLPVREWLVNQIWCHQKLNFKDGAYKVRWQAADLLVIERSGRAIIGVNDSFSTAQTATIQTDFGANVLLHDYSGANPADMRTDASGRMTITVPPCNGLNVRRGYSIWGPAGITGPIERPWRTTTQEWEMSDDLGDSHPSSLRQGGALPANSTATRTAGKIFPALESAIAVQIYASNPVPVWKVSVASSVGTASLTKRPNVSSESFGTTAFVRDYHTIQVQNIDTTSPSQTVWVKATYKGPRSRLATPPTFTKIPANLFLAQGQSGSFELSFLGTAPMTTQWFKDGSPLPGETATNLTFTNVTTAQAGTYLFSVNNDAGERSIDARLTVYTNSDAGVSISQIDPTQLRISIERQAGLKYRIDQSGDLSSWSAMTTNTAPFSFTVSPTELQQYFRAVYAP